MRGKAHIFLAAGNDDMGITACDALGSQMNCFQTPATDLIDSNARHFMWHTRFYSGLAGRVLTGTRGQYMTENDFINLVRLNPGPFQDRADDPGAKDVC